MGIDVRNILSATLECAMKRQVPVKDLLKENFVPKQSNAQRTTTV